MKLISRIHNSILKGYGKTKSKNKYANLLLVPVRKFLKLGGNITINFIKPPKDIKNSRIPDLIVSLTSFPGRIQNFHKVILSIKNQTVKPEKIILWLSILQFPDKILPVKLLNQLDDIFEIRFVNEDLKSHKKYFYAFQEFPDKNIITLDDDIIYHPFTIQYLWESHLENQEAVIANCTRIIPSSKDVPKPYREWIFNQEAIRVENLLPIGMGGVLYPVNSMHEIVRNKELFMSLTPFADDIWLNAVERLNDINVVQSRNTMQFLEIIQKTEKLCTSNKTHNHNDIYIKNVSEYFIKHFNKKIY